MAMMIKSAHNIFVWHGFLRKCGIYFPYDKNSRKAEHGIREKKPYFTIPCAVECGEIADKMKYVGLYISWAYIGCQCYVNCQYYPVVDVYLENAFELLFSV